jgi:hypothetical protein
LSLLLGAGAALSDYADDTQSQVQADIATTTIGQVPGYTADTANEEGYWYSRYNMMSLTMQSGMGETFMPDPQQMAMAVQMVAQNSSDPVMVPVNPALLSVVYAGGDPHYETAGTPMDWQTLRWKGGDTSVTEEASAWTITKELEWAKFFHLDAHFGTPTDDFGATQRFAGMMIAMMAKMQLMAWQQNPARFQASLAGDYAALTAFSDAAGIFGASALPYSTTNRYADPDAAALSTTLARQQFQKVIASTPKSASDLSLGIQSLVWYGALTTDAQELLQVREAVVRWAGQLAKKEPDNAVDRAYKIRGLVEAGRTLADEHFLAKAAKTFKALVKGFDSRHGVLRGTKTLTIEGAGEIAGAFNAAMLFLGDRIGQEAAKETFGVWWEGTVNLSGLQIAAPEISDFKGAYETDQDPLNYGYPTLPLPQDAGGAFGIAPVFAASVTWKHHGWTADQSRFDTAGSMHASNEMIWFHNDELNGFPTPNF